MWEDLPTPPSLFYESVPCNYTQASLDCFVAFILLETSLGHENLADKKYSNFSGSGTESPALSQTLKGLTRKPETKKMSPNVRSPILILYWEATWIQE